MANENDGKEMILAVALLKALRSQMPNLGVTPGDWVVALVKEAGDTLIGNLSRERRREGVRLMHDAVDAYLNIVIDEENKKDEEQDAAVVEALNVIDRAVKTNG